MGQAKQKKKHVTSVLSALRQLGNATSEEQEIAIAQSLHQPFLQQLFRQNEYAHYAYREALNHAEPAISKGLANYLDSYFSFGWEAETNQDYALTGAALVEVRTTALDVVAQFSSCTQLAQAIADSLCVPAEDVLLFPQLTDITVYDGFTDLATFVAYAKIGQPPPAKDNFRFGDVAGPGVFRHVLFRLRRSSVDDYVATAQMLRDPLWLDGTDAALAEVTYEIRDVEDRRATAQGYCRLVALGLPYTLPKAATFQEGEAQWSRWLQAATAKGLDLQTVAINVVIVDQSPINNASGVIPTSGQEPPDPQVALVIGDKSTKKLLDVVVFYEGAHALVAVPHAADFLMKRGVGEILIGGQKIDEPPLN